MGQASGSHGDMEEVQLRMMPFCGNKLDEEACLTHLPDWQSRIARYSYGGLPDLRVSDTVEKAIECWGGI